MPKPSDILNEHRPLIREIMLQFRIKNPRVFGSVIHKIDNENSDLDLLVDTLPENIVLGS